MIYGLTTTRHQEVKEEMDRMETFLVELGQEIRETTAPGFRYNHLWLQVDSTISYVRSLRALLQNESAAQN